MSSSNILVVDDEKSIRLTVAQSLEPQGYAVKTAVNGDDALARLKEQSFDLILTDLKMPGIDGMALIEQAVELYPEIKVIMISAHATVDNAVGAMKLGAVDFIQKPFTPQEIRDIVQRVLERQALGDQEEQDYGAMVELAKYQASERQFEVAIAQTKKAIGSDPSRPEAFDLLGMLQETLGDRLEALKNYRVAIDLDPTFESAKQNLDRATEDPSNRPTL
ncbi:Nitrogen regulation protein NR(I) [Acaryochloris thomasi RCC1774]|uniref:Nitrogen regulation protein NR(I) n=1 Tax=Acaryochloris thomasi RCC1774 TaxID=1764569 RepID=A0A2W1JN02_9CYAN|nr:response regulator [Acaryochloris thomasi]PZD72825.1 Nitrogen regulation protein NR(I) [Acaryochloris thomasi RCC1774]